MPTAEENPGPGGDQQQQQQHSPASNSAISSTGAVAPSNLPDALRLALSKMTTEDAPETRRHAFWETQPVSQFADPPVGAGQSGPIDRVIAVSEVRTESYPLPPSFVWSDCDVKDEAVLNEVYELLANNYVEDDDNMFRFAYPKPFLRWALQPPGYRVDWHVGVRVKTSGKLVAFITGIPATVCIDGVSMRMAEINFLCIHKKLRSKRLAPVLIKEVTRRVNLCDVWQATYTAGTVLPKPIASCRYYHRSLNPRKLIDIGFSRLGPRMTMARTVKLYSLAPRPSTPGLRLMEERDVGQVCSILGEFIKQFRLYPKLDEDDVRHWLLSRPEVVTSYVVARSKNEGDVGGDAESGGEEIVTDLISFYCLPSTIIGNDRHKVLKAAYLYYYVCNTVSLKTLLGDALIMAKNDDFDVFNALDIMHNKVGGLDGYASGATASGGDENNGAVAAAAGMNGSNGGGDHPLKELKFGIGDGNLQYYLYNWRVENDLMPNKVGLVLL